MANRRRYEWSDVYASFERMPQADGIAIHHGASLPKAMTFDPELLRGLEHGEMRAGYNCLAYHTMFSDDGDSAEARPYGAYGAATGGHNDHTIAFCHPGYFHPPYYHQISDAAVLSMAREIRALVDLGFLAADYIVRPHTWWTAGTQWATACCGSEFIPRVAQIDEWSRNIPAPAPPAGTQARGGTEMVVGYFAWQGQVLCYLLNEDGRVVRQFPQTKIGPFGFPDDALNVAERHGRFELTPEEWTAVVKTGGLPAYAHA